MNKILINIQGRTLILYYTVRQASIQSPPYIDVLPSDELSRFNLKGLTPEMFCVNIADMVNLRRKYAGQVENEKQVPVARWSLDRDEILEALNKPALRLKHRQISSMLATLGGYRGDSAGLYIDFEEKVAPQAAENNALHDAYRLTIVTEEVENGAPIRAYYVLGTQNNNGWQEHLPAEANLARIKQAIQNKLQEIRDAGIPVAEARDETDYALRMH